MDLKTFEWLSRMVDEAVNHPMLNDWEQEFIKDQQSRLVNWGPDTFFTPKQWAAVEKIAKKLDFEEAPNDSN